MRRILPAVSALMVSLSALPGVAMAEGEATVSIVAGAAAASGPAVNTAAFRVDPAGSLEGGKLTGPVTLTWRNDDSVAHEVVSDRFPSLTTGLLQPGQSMSFALEGTEKFGCVIHPSMRIAILIQDRYPLPTESPFFRVSFGIEPLEPGATSARVRGAYAGSPAFFALFEDDGGKPGTTVTTSASRTPVDSMTTVSLTRPLVQGETIWAVLALDTNGNGMFDGLGVDLPPAPRTEGRETGTEPVMGFVVNVVPTREAPVPGNVPASGDFGARDQQADNTPTPTPATAASEPEQNDPSLFSTVTTYLSTAVLIGALIWSAWYRRRKRR